MSVWIHIMPPRLVVAASGKGIQVRASIRAECVSCCLSIPRSEYIEDSPVCLSLVSLAFSTWLRLWLGEYKLILDLCLLSKLEQSSSVRGYANAVRDMQSSLNDNIREGVLIHLHLKQDVCTALQTIPKKCHFLGTELISSWLIYLYSTPFWQYWTTKRHETGYI